MIMLKLNALAATGAAAALVAGGTAAGAAIAGSPIDSSGVIHGCYSVEAHHGSHRVTLQNVGTTCPKGSIAISWNQRGPAGATGPAGPQGPAGSGLVFTTASGTNGPAITQTGTYFFDLSVTPENNTSSTALACSVAGPGTVPGVPGTLFDETYELPVSSSGTITLSGMSAVTAGTPLSVSCFEESTGSSLPILAAQWWVAPVQTAS